MKTGILMFEDDETLAELLTWIEAPATIGRVAHALFMPRHPERKGGRAAIIADMVYHAVTGHTCTGHTCTGQTCTGRHKSNNTEAKSP